MKYFVEYTDGGIETHTQTVEADTVRDENEGVLFLLSDTVMLCVNRHRFIAYAVVVEETSGVGPI